MAGRLLIVTSLALALLLTGCGRDGSPDADRTSAPELGTCRVLAPDDVTVSANSAATVDCGVDHSAETYAVGPLPSELAESAYDDPDVGAFVHETCSQGFIDFLGADESMAMRTLLSWAWFRPSEAAWDDGARWYRCDVVGGGEDAATFVTLPETAEGLMSSGLPDDEWMACVDGEAVPGAPRVACSEEHTWRAVTTIKVGGDSDPYPGDRLVEVRSRDYCEDSVLAWLDYPPEFKFAYTWFHEAEWTTGNRRSICWAWTAA